MQQGTRTRTFAAAFCLLLVAASAHASPSHRSWASHSHTAHRVAPAPRPHGHGHIPHLKHVHERKGLELPHADLSPPEGSTRGEVLMYKCLEVIASEGVSSTEDCKGKGPGIFTPPGAARAYAACSVAMFNAWALYTDDAVPILVAPEVVDGLRADRSMHTDENRAEAMTHALYRVLVFLLPGRADQLGRYMQDELGVDVHSALGADEVAATARLATDSYIDGFLRTDRFNQDQCYRDASNYFPVNDAFDLSNASTVAASVARMRNVYSWSDIVRQPARLARPGLLPQARFAKTYFIATEHYTPRKDTPEDTFLTAHVGFDEQMREVVQLQSTLAGPAGERARMMADYWADGPRSVLPPGHWLLLAMRHVARVQGYGLGQALQLLTALSVANHDGAVAAWTQKWTYSTARPCTYIPTRFYNETLRQQFVAPYCPFEDVQGASWMPYQEAGVVTPPFPEFPSGHSTFSAASAVILEAFTGSKLWPGGPLEVEIPKGSSRMEPYCSAEGKTFSGAPCTFVKCARNDKFSSANSFVPAEDITLGPYEKFTDTALEAGKSRLFGGIHVEAGNIGGLRLGAAIGRRVFDLLRLRHMGGLGPEEEEDAEDEDS